MAAGLAVAALATAGVALAATVTMAAAVAPDTVAAAAAPDTAAAAAAGPGPQARPAGPAPTVAPPAPAGGHQVSPTLAVLMSPVWPGWGQLWTGDGWRAALAFGAEMFYWSRLLRNDQQAVRYQEFGATLELPELRERYAAATQEYRELVRDYAWWSGGAMLIIALDAYVNAHLYRFDRDPVPVPDDWRTLPEGVAGGSASGPDGMVVWAWSADF